MKKQTAAKQKPQPHPVLSLPFVRERRKGEIQRCFWEPESTGDYHEDLKVGREYATAALDYICRDSAGFLLGHIALDMIDNKKDCKGIIVGFFHEITHQIFPHIKIQDNDLSLKINDLIAQGKIK